MEWSQRIVPVKSETQQLYKAQQLQVGPGEDVSSHFDGAEVVERDKTGNELY